MLSDRERNALFDIRGNGLLAQAFVGGLSMDEFKADRRAFYATTRALEIVSEAARRLPADLRPGLPWRKIMGVGNVFRHAYESVAEEQVWLTVRDYLPALLDAVALEIDRLDEPG